MATKQSTADLRHTLNMYVSGFVLSVVLTLAAYVLVQANLGSGEQLLSHPVVIVSILIFAVAQLIVQLYFFLHLGEESRPRWRLLALLFAATVVLIVVIGSIWIMANLNYHMMDSPQAVNQYLQSQGGL